MSALVERLAEVLWNAENPFWTGGDPFGKSRPWLWVEADESARWPWLQMAERVAAGMGLTEEFTWSWSETLTLDGRPGYGFSVPSREEAEREADSYMSIVARWVSPWLEVEQ